MKYPAINKAKGKRLHWKAKGKRQKAKGKTIFVLQRLALCLTIGLLLPFAAVAQEDYENKPKSKLAGKKLDLPKDDSSVHKTVVTKQKAANETEQNVSGTAQTSDPEIEGSGVVNQS